MYMKRILIAACLFAHLSLCAQFVVPITGKKQLANVEDTLDALGNKMLDDPDLATRLRSDSLFTRSLVRALRMPNSFYYPFDSVETLTIAYPQDSSFRIFTWQYEINEQNFRQKGAIQKKTIDGSLQLFPLFDASEYTEAPNDSVRQSNNWIGAIYYKIIQKEVNGQQYYTLLGYDENGYRSTKKWVDVLTFNSSTGQPQFGGSFFNFGGADSLFQPGWQRFNIEFKKEGRARLMYDDEKGMIVFDHLISESKEPEKKFSYIPDGDFEGLKWEGGKWVYVDNVVGGLALKNGEEPHPDLIMDENGQINEAKLEEQSEKNAGKKIEAKQIKRKNKIEVTTSSKKKN
jgi:hypothetical protein